MHTSVRKYKIDPGHAQEMIRRVDQGFAARLEEMPGFIAYELLDCGYGIMITLTTCRDRESAERSVELAAEFVGSELEDLDLERVEATIGEVGVSRAVAEMLEPTRA
jgi:hypothetical protein